MIKKTLFSIGLALCLLLVTAAPVQADGPDFQWYDNPAVTYVAADCSQYGYDFTIAHTWDEEGHILTFYNKDGSIDYFMTHAKMVHTFTNTITGKSVSGEATDTGVSRMVVAPPYGVLEIRGAFQRIIVPGVGPIFMDIGRKVFTFTWLPDGSLHFDLLFNAGPSTYTSNDFSGLCAYLAEE